MSDQKPSFGHVSLPLSDPPKRDRFRIAVFGDFSGRAAKGLIETGAALTNRRAIVLDVDTIDDVIAGFETNLVLELGQDGAGIEVELDELDDFHPDELYDALEVFREISGLRQQLDIGSMSEKAVEKMQAWAELYGTDLKLKPHSASNVVPADKRLSDFQALIGAERPTAKTGSLDDLIARFIGPHVVAAPDPGVEALKEALDEALSTTMRTILHHPEFQAVEAQWRSLDLLARSIETDEALEIVLYDLSAEELAVDLAASNDLSKSGLFGLLSEAKQSGLGAGAKTGGFSALFGLYQFEHTPPHAELLGRLAKIAAHADAPFFTSISPQFLDESTNTRHPLVAQYWEKLRALPEAEYLGIATPRFMLRHPYGSKSDPISSFKFEEFTEAEGLSGLLWANPVVLVAILLAKTWTDAGAEMQLGKVMSLGGIPYHIVKDRYGDQIALPCTERNLTEAKIDQSSRLGFMPVLSFKGRDEIRLASFMSVGKRQIAGRWSDPNRERIVAEEIEPEAEDPGAVDPELDELLSSFSNDMTEGDTSEDDGEIMDEELRALLEDL